MSKQLVTNSTIEPNQQPTINLNSDNEPRAINKTTELFNVSIPPADYQKFRAIISNKRFVAIDGLIGAGKTTLIRLITDYYHTNGFKIHPIYEPVEMWHATGALNLFYADIPAKCYEFQSFVYVSRIKKVIQEVLAHSDAEIFILERTVFTDRYIFVEMLRDLFGATRMAMYTEWWDMWSCINPIHINKWVLLDVSLAESLRRIKARSRNAETGISTEYQTNLQAKHHEFYARLQETIGAKEHEMLGDVANVLIIPPTLMDMDYITNQEQLIQIAELIISGLTISTEPPIATENNLS